jgi:NAD(P)-dependent dehydrogenase (short-subunit alcohol dehydrogenase family)
MFSIDGLKILIVGGSRGIGQALVFGFIRANARVTILDINVPDFKSEFNFIKCDLSDHISIQKALKKYHADNSVADVLINCAAITIPGESHIYNDKDLSQSLSLYIWLSPGIVIAAQLIRTSATELSA